jgi:hypothetical protein
MTLRRWPNQKMRVDAVGGGTWGVCTPTGLIGCNDLELTNW